MGIYKFLIPLIICISLTACGISDDARRPDETKRPAETVSENENDPVDVFQAIAEDKEFDGKSLIWDGEKAQIVDDELDSRDVLDGRYGEFELVTLETGIGFDLVLPKTSHNSDLFMSSEYPPVDTDDEFSIETQDRFLSLKKEGAGTFDQKAAELSSGGGLMESDSSAIKSETGHKLFTGIIKTTSGENMAGFLLLINGEDSVYTFRYAGLGNYSDIRVEAFSAIRRLLNQF
jgi:hypothetical protein